MAIRTLSSHTALVPGADLWVTADTTESDWSKRLDWYLNFQLTKAKNFQSEELGDSQIEALREWDLPIYEKPPQEEDRKNLMISSSHLLPNRQTVVISYAGDLERWVERARTVWASLNQPTLRLFLPDGVKQSEVVKLWTPSEDTELTFVESAQQRSN